MTQALLNSNNKVIAITTIRLTTTDRHSDSEKTQCRTFDEIIGEKLGDSMKQPPNPDNIPFFK